MSRQHHCYLVLDQGGHASRAIIFDRDGNVLEAVEHALETKELPSGYIEHDPKQLLDSLKQAAEEVCQKLTLNYRENLQSAALVCQRSSLACWHRETQQSLYNIISWQDRRAASWLSDWLEKSALGDDIYKRTGLFANAHFGASKMRWLLKNVEAVQQALAEGQLNCAPLACYLVQQLTEEKNYLLDAGNASRTLLWNVNQCCWDESLLQYFDIPSTILPAVKPCNAEFGHIRLGSQTIPLRFVNGDQNAAFFAHGALESDRVYVNLGTGAFCAALVQGETRQTGLLKTLAVMDSSPVFMLEGTVNGGGSALAWAANKMGVNVDYQCLNKELLTDGGELLFINGIGGLGSPYWQSEFPSQFIGEGSAEQKLAAVIDSVLFLLQRNMDFMEEQGIAITRIQLSGGMSKSDGLCQRLADLSQKEVCRSDIVEASARGAAFWLAACPSFWKNNIGAQIFSPRNKPIAARYQAWLKAMDQRLRSA